ncbi:hypothetical protein [Novosphingobium resinovorum]|uniref:Uncharacterized protein n=1 Tax=Novosphingobium resinovorum TaxID=158500 RepID=A0A1D8A370_9SPHN|nr:hypothetical protein [Novosphingobium resinovorum]AOR76567.1 hypothetical protein BES08_07255 [Novosphingobium resinovorum]
MPDYPTTARLWPYQPNWDDGVDVQVEYRTDIFTARSGREQRRALRSAPRRQITYSVALDGETRQRFVRDIRTWQGRPMLLPDPLRSARISAFVPADSDVFTLPAIPHWLGVGTELLIAGSLRRTVTAVDADLAAVTVDDHFADVLAVGTRVQPLLRGILGGSISAAHPVSRVATARLVFAVEPGTEPAPAEGGPGVYIHEGREVFAKRPNWVDGVGEAFEWPVEQVDYGHGRVSTFQPIEMGWLTQTATYLNVGPTEQTEMESFYHRMRGRRGEFLMPTWTDDITVVGDAAEGSPTLLVTGLDDGETGAIMIRLRSGRVLTRQVTATAGGQITVNRTWLEAFTAADVAMVCRLEVARFSSDALTFEWPTTVAAQVKIGFRTLEPLPAENPVEPLDDLSQYLLETSWGDYLDPLDDLDWAVNVRYPAIQFEALPWNMVHEDVLDSFDYFINFTIPESME